MQNIIRFNLNDDSKVPSLISARTLWKLVGIFSVSLPFILVFGNAMVSGTLEFLISVSSYYHTAMRNIFVGILSAIAFFLFSYNGYNNKWGWIDRLCSKLACILVIVIAYFPIGKDGDELNPIGVIHIVCAISFFVLISFMSFYLFTKTYPDKRIEGRKRIRNLIYVSCGVSMFVFIAGITLNYFVFKVQYVNLALESACLCLFGVSWLTKGNAIFKDKAMAPHTATGKKAG